ncbi:hypothetical protein [Chryseobacterium sp. 18068]|uniref:hypothetical protein n=1 Tax=Chryseobacterium sp. 18068 TaxID=2681414 RepID=UPI00135BC766|nr:hypothetical protein [Chryseobacterium sp. 18068]
MNTITRKIQLLINDQDHVKEVFETLFKWQEIVFRSYNYTATHLYIQENLKEFFYMNEEFRISLTKKSELNEGILNTSKQNTTYQLLSSKFKGDIPMDIIACVNQRIVATFNKERLNYFSGKSSLRTYKRTVPIPFSKTSMLDFKESIDNNKNVNYTFSLFGLHFKTFFGKDSSNNREIFEKALAGDYKFGGSSIIIEGKKIFLLATIQFESIKQNTHDSNKIAYAYLSFNNPIVVKIGKKIFEIGTKDGYLHRRIAIRAGKRRLQKNLTDTKGGKGRIHKFKALEQFESKEKDYINTVLHTYSKNLMELCRKNNIGKLILENQSEEIKSIESRIKEIKNNLTLTNIEKRNLIENSKFVISNWSYYGLLEKIIYKSKIYGIEVIKE